MKTEYFLARRLMSGKENKNNLSLRIARIAVLGVALGLCVMIISIAVVTGFKNEIRAKVIGFGAHIQLVNYDSNMSYETAPVSSHLPYIEKLKKIDGVKRIQVFATKPGILKVGTEMQGVVLKGVDRDYDWSFFKANLIEGKVISFNDTTKSDDIIISKWLSKKLNVKLNDKVTVFFVQDPPRMRRFTVCGIYETGLEEFDKACLVADIAHIKKLNGWSDDQVSGFEIMLSDFDHLDQIKDEVSDVVASSFVSGRKLLQTVSIRQKYPQLFDWLDLQNMNVWIILSLMLAVAGINLISGLLILVLDRTQFIGLIKALGAKPKLIRKIFLSMGLILLSRGLFWGNLIGITFCLIQQYTGVLKLDQSSYYLSQVPIHLNILYLVLLNAGTIFVSFAILLLPGIIVKRLDPVELLRYE